MIQLSPESIKADPMYELFQGLPDEYYPTHAVDRGILANGDVGQYRLEATYWVGHLDASGNFVQMRMAAIITISLPNMQSSLVPREEVDQILENLFGADVAPDPTDPRLTVPAPGKLQGDWKRRDVDAICSWLHPRLKGTVV